MGAPVLVQVTTYYFYIKPFSLGSASTKTLAVLVMIKKRRVFKCIHVHNGYCNLVLKLSPCPSPVPALEKRKVNMGSGNEIAPSLLLLGLLPLVRYPRSEQCNKQQKHGSCCGFAARLCRSRARSPTKPPAKQGTETMTLASSSPDNNTAGTFWGPVKLEI